ncbi:hypothetical protein J6590_080680 [Homalodisca vitripennis]|nr:hypothetical protein J6590_080680 [Homalodisca vitripennis]
MPVYSKGVGYDGNWPVVHTCIDGSTHNGLHLDSRPFTSSAVGLDYLPSKMKRPVRLRWKVIASSPLTVIPWHKHTTTPRSGPGPVCGPRCRTLSPQHCSALSPPWQCRFWSAQQAHGMPACHSAVVL